jgi:hypothetical protein
VTRVQARNHFACWHCSLPVRQQKCGWIAVVADGLFDEFQIARTQGAAVIPVGATGSAAKELADKVSAEPNQFVPELDADGRAMLGAIAASTADLDSLIDPVMELIHKLQEKG